jgi:hypothetical protein
LLRDDPDDRVVIHYDRGSPVSDDELQALQGGSAAPCR